MEYDYSFTKPPEEILGLIMIKLGDPAKVCEIRGVCKEWKRIIEGQLQSSIRPIDISSRGGFPRILQTIYLEKQNLQTTLQEVVEKGNLLCLSILIKRGIDKDIKDEEGNSLLHLSARFGYDVMTQALLKIGASTHAVNEAQQIPLKVALEKGHLPVVELLAPHLSLVQERKRKPAAIMQ